MNGLHDLGGMHGFGALPLEPDEPVFHDTWEGRIFALSIAMGRHFGMTLDQSRNLMESFEPYNRLSMSYYERWVKRVLMAGELKGLLSPEDVAAVQQGRVPTGAKPADTEAQTPDQILQIFFRGGQSFRPIDSPAAFTVGDQARAKVMHPRGHTRIPRYVRGKLGEILHDHGGHVFPDTNALDPPQENPCRLYTVRFSARELWGAEVNARDSVCLDMWERYLEQP